MSDMNMTNSRGREIHEAASGLFLVFIAWLVTLSPSVHCHQMPLKSLQTEAALSEARTIVKNVAIIGTSSAELAQNLYV